MFYSIKFIGKIIKLSFARMNKMINYIEIIYFMLANQEQEGNTMSFSGIE